MKKIAMLGLCATLALATVASATTGIPDLSMSTATSNPGHLLISPKGTGPSLAEADVVITLTLLDGTGTPISNYPFQDMWVDDDGNGDIFMCHQASLADHNTDAAGVTTFSGSFTGGGWTQNGLRVYVAGMPIANDLLAIDVASPDYNRDNRVDIVDLGQFAMDYIDVEYDFWCDFNGDGAEDLADLGIFAAHHGTLGCP